MNIFFLSYDPEQCARWYMDKHVTKIIVELGQMLCTAHRVIDGDDHLPASFYKATHINHPMSRWVRNSVRNYQWSVDLLYALLSEYTHRFGKVKYDRLRRLLKLYLVHPPRGIFGEEWRLEPPLCMPKEYTLISQEAIVCYRCYYLVAKRHLASWTNREPPPWWPTK